MDIVYPKILKENLLFRAKILERAENDREYQEALKEACRKNRLFFFNVFLYTYDPRKEIKDIPFITYKFQDEELILWDAECATNSKDNLFEKTRDMGVTFCLGGNDLYDWLFSEQRVEIRWGSRKEQYVDTRGDMDCIFEKFRYMLRHFPNWLLPKGFSFNEHDNTMRLINPETGSIISGEATNDDFGRGGRKYRIRFDEFAFWECDENAWKACADATRCRTALSTPSGSGNKFAHLANENTEKIAKKTLHWTLHPEKSKGAYYLDPHGDQIPLGTVEEAFECWLIHRNEKAGSGLKGGVVRSLWYDAECERRTEKEIAEELDIDYLASGSPFYDLVELLKQKEWEYGVRANPTMEIPNGRYIKANIIEVQHKPKILERPDGWVRIFELPKKNHQYLVAADTAEGLPKGDECAAVLKDKWTLNTCAVIKGRMAPEDFAYKLFMLSKLFNECMAAPENNNHGYTTCRDFEELGGNLYYTRPANQAKHSLAVPKRGWTTDIRSRPEMLDISAENIRCHATELRDPDLISQCKTFVHNDKTGKPEGDGSFLDDCVIANAICDAVIRQYPYKPASSINKYKQVARDMKRVRNGGYSFAPR